MQRSCESRWFLEDEKMIKRLLISLTLLALIATPVWAGTVFGNTGYIIMPEAEVIPTGQLEIGAHFADGAMMSVGFGIFDHVELSLNTNLKGGDLGYTAKLLLNAESSSFPGVAIGVDSGDIYIALSRSFGQLRATLGFGTGFFHGVFAGASYQLNPIHVGKWQTAPKLLLDWNGYLLNGGVELPLAPKLNLSASFIDFDHGMLGLTYKVQF
jgi:hypothetical protein